METMLNYFILVTCLLAIAWTAVLCYSTFVLVDPYVFSQLIGN